MNIFDQAKNVITYTLDATTKFTAFRRQQSGPIEIQPSLDYLRFVQLIQMLQDPRSEIAGVWIITFNYFAEKKAA
jgi:hypothetical protein